MKKKMTDENGKVFVMKEKKPFYKRVWFWILIVIVGGGIAAGMGGNSEPEATKVGESKEETTTSSEAPQEFNIGDTVDIEGYQIRVDSVEYSDGTEYNKPDEGKQFVVIKLTITNQSDEKSTFNGFDYSVNVDGVNTNAMDYLEGYEDLGSGDLDKGASVSGYLISQAAPGTKIKLRYDGNLFLKDHEVLINLR